MDNRQRASTRIYLLVVIVSTMCLAAMGTISALQAQTAQTGTDARKMPLSFYGLQGDQEIRFSVYTDHPQASFGVEVLTQPQPQAKIRLLINSSIQNAKAEKIWGHPAGEQITRALTSSDLRTLETFLAGHRSRGAVPPPAQSGHPAMSFERITYRVNQQGNRYADIDRKEFYPVSEEAQRDFIKNFIGFSEPGSN